MKTKENFNILKSLVILLFIVPYLTGCFPDRTVTEPDYKADDVRRPAVKHHVPLSEATDVNRNTTISVWFDELMNESSIQNNFAIWPSIKIDSIQAIAINSGNPNIIYAGKLRKGIFRSDNSGDSWRWLTPEWDKMTITDLIVCQNNSDVIYAATIENGISKSVDGGVVWQQINNGLPELNVLSIAVDPTNDDVIYAAMNSTGIYKSEDGGTSWFSKNNGVNPSKGPLYIVISPLNTNILYTATNGDVILKSTNGGESWTKIKAGTQTGLFTFNFNSVAIHPQDTALVFAGSSSGGMYKTEDGGSKWTLLTGLKVQSIIVHPQDTNKVLINTPNGVLKSFDKGKNWLTTGNISTISMFVIDPVSPQRLFASTNAGIYRSEDLGDSWREKNNLPLENLYISGSFAFETWQDSTRIIAPLNSTTVDTTIIFPYIYERALAAWLAYGKKGDPPVEINPLATKMTFTSNTILPPNIKIQARFRGTFEDDRETLRNSYGTVDIHGNTFEVDHNFTFITGSN